MKDTDEYCFVIIVNKKINKIFFCFFFSRDWTSKTLIGFVFFERKLLMNSFELNHMVEWSSFVHLLNQYFRRTNKQKEKAAFSTTGRRFLARSCRVIYFKVIDLFTRTNRHLITQSSRIDQQRENISFALFIFRLRPIELKRRIWILIEIFQHHFGIKVFKHKHHLHFLIYLYLSTQLYFSVV